MKSASRTPDSARPHTVRGDRLVETTDEVNQEVAGNAMLLSQGARRAIDIRADGNEGQRDEAIRLVTEADFDEWVARKGVIVNVDPATDAAEDGPKAHAWGCPYLTKEHFLQRFVNGNGQGGYYWVPDLETAERALGARGCRARQDPLNR
jgi:hypothetical protein